jgi:hypothetical protein
MADACIATGISSWEIRPQECAVNDACSMMHDARASLRMRTRQKVARVGWPENGPPPVITNNRPSEGDGRGAGAEEPEAFCPL